METFYHKGKPVPEEDLEQIESIEDDDGEIRERYRLKDDEFGPVFITAKKNFYSKEYSPIYMGWATTTYTPTYVTSTTTTIPTGNIFYQYYYYPITPR